MLDAVRSGRPRTSAENIERVRQAFSLSPIKSIRTAVSKLELPPTTVHKVLHKRLRLYAHKIQMLQRLQPNDITDLKQRISNVIASIDEAILQRTWQEIEYRLDVLHVRRN